MSDISNEWITCGIVSSLGQLGLTQSLDLNVAIIPCMVNLRNNSLKSYCVVSFNMGWWILVFYPEW